MMLTHLLTLRSLRERPLRFLLSMFGIILGVAGILGMGITNEAAMSAITRLFGDTSGRANLVVVSAGGEGDALDERLVRQIARYPGIETAVPSLHITTLLTDEALPAEIGMSLFGASSGGLVLYGIDPALDSQTRDYALVDGQLLSSNAETDEIVLVNTYATEHDLTLGSWVEVVTEYGTERLRLVGLIDEQGPGRINNGAFGVIPLALAQKYFDRPYELDQIDIISAPDYQSKAAIETLKTSLQAQLGRNYSVIFPAAQGQRMMQMLGNYRIGLDFLSGMALFVGAFLIYNAFSMTVVERTREIGMLRTIGLTQRQVAFQIVVEAGLLGFIGALLGIGLGILLSLGLTRLMAILLDQDLSSVALPLDLVLRSGLIGLFVAVVAALIPAWNASRISPLEALRTRGTKKEGWFARRGWRLGVIVLLASVALLLWNPLPDDPTYSLGSMAVMGIFLGGTLTLPAIIGYWERATRQLIKRIYGNSGMLGSRNIERAKSRTTLTVAALMVGVSMMIVVWVMTESFKGDVKAWLEGYMGGDIYITSSVNLREDLQQRLYAVDGVTAVTPVRYFETEMITAAGDTEKILYSAVEPETYRQVTSFTFEDLGAGTEATALAQLGSGDTIFISSVVAELYGLKVGDSLSLATKTGPRPFEVGAIVVDFYNQGLVIHGSWRDMKRHFRIEDAQAFMLKVDDQSHLDDVKARIENTFGDRYHLVVESNQSLKQRASQLMEQAFSMFDVLALIAMIVAFLGISNTLTMNVLERTQEIGMLRSIGMTRHQVLSTIMAEAGALGLLGGILGVLFGLVLSRLLLAAMASMSGYSITFALPVARVILGLLIAIAVAHLAAILPSRQAARVEILEAIRFE